MSDSALIVGCDSYLHVRGGDLHSAVTDAMAIRTWLVDPTGGALNQRDVVMLLSPSAGGVQPDPATVHGPASRSRFAAAVRDLLDRGEVEGSRLYVYFAGHGCRTDPSNAALSRDAIAFTNFDPDDPATGTVGVFDLRTRLEQSRFAEIVLLLDACRDFPFREPFQLGGLGRDPDVDQNRRQWPRVFLGQATVPGGVATAQNPALGGDFTRAVLAGLRGHGTAKVFDESRDPPYVVQWATLRAYVATTVPDARMPGDGELTLAAFPDGTFARVRLRVDVDPGPIGVAPDLRVRVRYPNPTELEDDELHFTGPAPVTATVPPRRHQITGRRGGHQGKQWFDVYTDSHVRLRMNPVEAMGHGGSPPPPPPGGSGGPGEPVTRPGSNYRRIELTTDDPMAAIEIRNLSGQSVARGVGRVHAKLTPRSYHVEIADPDGRDTIQTIDVEAGPIQEVQLIAPKPRGALLDALGGTGLLQWASGAARTVAALPPPDGPGPARLAVAVPLSMGTPRSYPIYPIHPGNFELISDHDQVTMIDDAFGQPTGWITTSTMEGTHNVGIDIAGNRLTVPILDGADTAVYVGEDNVIVELFDQQAVHDPARLLRLDRAQRYAGRHRPDLALAVLAIPSPWVAGPAESALRTLLTNATSQPDTAGITAASVPPSEQHELLDAGPWRVMNYGTRTSRRGPGPPGWLRENTPPLFG